MYRYETNVSIQSAMAIERENDEEHRSVTLAEWQILVS
jgi:hypothetical protein